MYDARGGGSSNGSGTMFGLALGGVVLAAFAAVSLWPSGSNDAPKQVASANQVQVSAAFASKEEMAFASALKSIDAASYSRLEKRFRNGNLTSTKRHEIMLEEVETVAFEHIDILAKSDVKHLNYMLTDIRKGLQQASQSNAKLCKGKNLVPLSTMDPRQMEKYLEREILGNEDVREFGIKLNRRLLDAIIDAKKNPKNYGMLSASEQRAIQNLAQKLMFQPEIMGLMMAANSNRNPEDVLNDLDICKLSLAVLRSVNSLPDNTKGKIWAQAMSDVKRKGGFDLDPSSMSGIGGF